jgi:hypothetical protein
MCIPGNMKKLSLKNEKIKYFLEYTSDIKNCSAEKLDHFEHILRVLKLFYQNYYFLVESAKAKLQNRTKVEVK